MYTHLIVGYNTIFGGERPSIDQLLSGIPSKYIIGLLSIFSNAIADVICQVDELEQYFKTTPILLKEWRSGAIYVPNIPEFIEKELVAARHFNPKHPFNPPLMRLLAFKNAVKNQLNFKLE